ncbi:hypothetical protein VTO42DRAFT_2265 [Malbranchea cinnamomea]
MPTTSTSPSSLPDLVQCCFNLIAVKSASDLTPAWAHLGASSKDHAAEDLVAWQEGTDSSKELADQLLEIIKQDVLTASKSSHLTYKQVDLSTGPLVIDALNNISELETRCPRLSYNSVTKTLDAEVMSTFTHDCHQEWLQREIRRMISSQFTTEAEFDSCLKTMVESSFANFQSPYAGSRKEPDMAIKPRGVQGLPSFVIESGWTENLTDLHEDMRLWLIGGSGHVRLVLLLKWTKIPSKRVIGVAESWSRDATGSPNLQETVVIFPEPHAGGANQTIRITRGQLFGAALPHGRNPADVFGLSVSTLRREAREAMRDHGFVPMTHVTPSTPNFPSKLQQ